MAIWDLFKKSPQKTYFNTLHKKLHEKFPDDDEDELIRTACIAGLFASVAYIDFEIHRNEQSLMEKSLVHWMDYPPEKARAVSGIAFSDTKELAGVENYTYSEALASLLDEQNRYGLLEALFELAASDGGVSEKESEEIRIIAKGLKLSHRHFLSARATVLEYLDALKGINRS